MADTPATQNASSPTNKDENMKMFELLGLDTEEAKHVSLR